jgi:hypothetical protein
MKFLYDSDFISIPSRLAKTDNSFLVGRRLEILLNLSANSDTNEFFLFIGKSLAIALFIIYFSKRSFA